MVPLCITSTTRYSDTSTSLGSCKPCQESQDCVLLACNFGTCSGACDSYFSVCLRATLSPSCEAMQTLRDMASPGFVDSRGEGAISGHFRKLGWRMACARLTAPERQNPSPFSKTKSVV